MQRIQGFVLGVFCGALLGIGALKYHLVRAEDGLHLVPKMSADFTDPYVDIRQFDLRDWDRHRSLAAAMMRANKGDLLQDSATASLRNSLNDVLDTLNVGGRRER